MMELYRAHPIFWKTLESISHTADDMDKKQAKHRGDVQEDAPAHLFNMRQREETREKKKKDRITMFVPAPAWISTRTRTLSTLLVRIFVFFSSLSFRSSSSARVILKGCQR